MILLIYGGCLFCGPKTASGQEINLEVRVLEQKMTDTINDFAYDGQDFTKPQFKAILGASTVRAEEEKKSESFYQFKWWHPVLVIVLILGYLVTVVFLPKKKFGEETQP